METGSPDNLVAASNASHASIAAVVTFTTSGKGCGGRCRWSETGSPDILVAAPNTANASNKTIVTFNASGKGCIWVGNKDVRGSTKREGHVCERKGVFAGNKEVFG